MVQLMLLGIISDGGKRWPALVPFSTEKGASVILMIRSTFFYFPNF